MNTKKSERLHEVMVDVLGPGVFAGKRVLDVGCGRFVRASAMKAAGATVTALDICDFEAPPEGITFIRTDFLKWQPEEGQRFDILYLDKVAMFMSTEELFKKIESLDAPVLAVRAMYDFPEPNWDPPKPLNRTSPEDWIKRFEPLGYKTVYQGRHGYFGPDRQGVDRLFRMTDYIAVKQ